LAPHCKVGNIENIKEKECFCSHVHNLYRHFVYFRNKQVQYLVAIYYKEDQGIIPTYNNNNNNNNNVYLPNSSGRTNYRAKMTKKK
jgi:hypothetical protein